ncbi:NUDIX hydrolase [Thermosinus carboxydivorans Nor1]|uniref:NUDIX hydrolase n=1 Tax=Thermosinus carboxydivorans Nor1 TaxID=401526 RepID=A1HTQ6_9FIRM|nr:NUDIX hydrolase [Thermosinus carboxydivorans]EAX46606.1 NUDIX hydrolase [Thermosinus carboxydivorans Nor1]
MQLLEEQLLKSTRVFTGKVIGLRVDTVRLPDGREATREVVEHPGAVAIVPVLSDGRIVLVRQYRHATRQVMLEIPAGKLAKGEDPDVCAARELEEETGFISRSLCKVATVYTTPGFTDEIMHLYVAQQLEPSVQRPDEDEFIQLEYYTKDELRAALQQGAINDAKTMLGLLLAGI